MFGALWFFSGWGVVGGGGEGSAFVCWVFFCFGWFLLGWGGSFCGWLQVLCVFLVVSFFLGFGLFDFFFFLVVPWAGVGFLD